MFVKLRCESYAPQLTPNLTEMSSVSHAWVWELLEHFFFFLIRSEPTPIPTTELQALELCFDLPCRAFPDALLRVRVGSELNCSRPSGTCYSDVGTEIKDSTGLPSGFAQGDLH